SRDSIGGRRLLACAGTLQAQYYVARSIVQRSNGAASSCWSTTVIPARTAAPATLPPNAAKIERISPISCLPGFARLELDHLRIRELRQLRRGAGEDREGGVVDRNHGLDAGQGDGPGGGGRSHGVLPADRQHRDGRSPGSHERHVAEQVRVARVIDPGAVLELDQPTPATDLASRLRAIASDGDATRMHGVEHGQLDPGRLDRAALVHADGLHPEPREVDLELVAADHSGT